MIAAGSISALKKLDPNDRFEGTFLVQSKEVRTKKNGVPFLSLTLADRTGSIDAKVWDNVEELATRFQANDFIQAQGRIQVFNNRHQVIVTRLRSLPEERVRLRDFIPHTDRDIDAMYEELLAAVDELSDPHLKRLMSTIFRDPEFARLYKRVPAAKANHHAKIGGLLEHAMSMLQVARLMATHYTDLDSDLLICGALLHDCGKVFELSADRGFDYTDRGRLLGHIPMGSAWLERKCDEIKGFPPRLRTLLVHLVLSHHGHTEFGSPQVPMFREALLLHFIDDLDSKLEMMREAEGGIVPGSAWSPFHKGLGRFVLDKNAYLRGSESVAAIHQDPPSEAIAASAGLQGVSEDESLPRPDRQGPQAAPDDSAELQSAEAAGPDQEAATDRVTENPESERRNTASLAAEQAVRPEPVPPATGEQPAPTQEAQPRSESRPNGRPAMRPKSNPSPPTLPKVSQVQTSPSPPLPNQIPPQPIREDPND